MASVALSSFATTCLRKSNTTQNYTKSNHHFYKFNFMKHLNLSLLRILLSVIIAIQLSSCNGKEEPAPDNSEIEVNKAKTILNGTWFYYEQKELSKSVNQITFNDNRFTEYWNFADRYKITDPYNNTSYYTEWDPYNFPRLNNGTYSLKINDQDPNSFSFIAEIKYDEDSNLYNLLSMENHIDVLNITFISVDKILIQGNYHKNYDGVFQRGTPPEIF